MGFHTYDIDRAERLEKPDRYRYLSMEELYSYLKPSKNHRVIDLGSGTGFYTDDVAPFVDELIALDIQSEMHQIYQEKGIPSNVYPITADISDIPIMDNAMDIAFSTMTYHEFANKESLNEINRILNNGGRFVSIDWSSKGSGAEGPPLTERYNLETALSDTEKAGFNALHTVERTETFVLVAETE